MYQATTSIDYIKKLTKYRDVDGSTKYASVWINSDFNDNNLKIQTHCLIGQVNEAGTYLAISDKDSCDNDLHSFICQRFTVVLCKNACFQRGVCIGQTCLCDEGWEGDDCSAFHCNNVNHCGGHGVCFGPNQCKCDPGWTGKACSSSYCPRFAVILI